MNIILKYFNSLLNFSRQNIFSRETFIDIDEGIVRADCSGIFNSFFKNLDENSYDKLLLKFEKKRLQASDYFELFSDDFPFSNHFEFKVIKDLRNLKAGDIFAWKKMNIPKSGDTGHMGILLSPLEKIEKNKYKASVADVSKNPHDEDIREEGLGSGIMYFICDDSFELSGYIWSTQRKKNKRTRINCVRLRKKALS